MSPTEEPGQRDVLRKVSWRLLPFLCLLYIVNILDRSNVSFARLQMLDDLDMSDGAYALGAGAFFITYAALGVPSNLVLSALGARRWIAAIMVSWGLISGAMMLVRGPWSFTLLRLLLGCAEAGFFPGILLYLTYWFPARERARAVALFMAASPVAGILGAPMSGALMQYAQGLAGLAGWQWLFLLEAVPAVLLGILVLFCLTDRPEQARWLSDEERDWLVKQLRRDEQFRNQDQSVNLRQVLADGRLWLLAGLFSAIATGISGLGAYLPALIQQRFPGRGEFEIGLLAAIPSIGTMIGMVMVAAHSDRTGERRWHVAGSALVAAVGWSMCALLEGPLPGLLGLTLAQTGMMSALAPFWALTGSFLRGLAAAGGIALINAIGNLGGFAGPNIIGQFQGASEDYAPRLLAMALLLIVSAGLCLAVRLPAADSSKAS
jgi:ACS family tartrate transporter-like MFS transporter